MQRIVDVLEEVAIESVACACAGAGAWTRKWRGTITASEVSTM